MRFSVFLSLFLISVVTLVAISGGVNARSKISIANPKYAAIVVEEGRGRVLFSRRADQRRPPASLTKVMTLFILFDALDRRRLRLQDRIVISANAARKPSSRLGLKKGESITVEEAIFALVTKSANDVATAIAERISGSERKFARLMNRWAYRMGMRRTKFRNASGLPDAQQVSTARDMYRLARSIRRRFPHYYHYFSTRSFKFRNQVFGNHNNLLGSYPGVDGLKTGYVNASGFNIVTSVQRGRQRLIGVVFGGRTAVERDIEMQRLLDLGFSRISPLQFRDRGRHQNVRLHRGGARQANAGVRQRNQAMVAPRPRYRPTRLAQKEAAVRRGQGSRVGSRTGGRRATTAQRRNWAIQIGAFKARSAARKQIEKVRRALRPLAAPQVRSTIDSIYHRDLQLFRARLSGLTRDDARRACAALAEWNFDCQVIGPNA